MAAKIGGICNEKFRRVREVSAANFENDGEIGAAIAVTLDGAPLLDLWGGHAGHARTRPWTRTLW